MTKSASKQSIEAEEKIRNLAVELEATMLNFKEKLRQLDNESSQKIQLLQNQIVEYKQNIEDLKRQLMDVKEKNESFDQSLAAEKNSSSLNVSNTSNSSTGKDGNSVRLTRHKSFDLSNNFILRQVEVTYDFYDLIQSIIKNSWYFLYRLVLFEFFEIKVNQLQARLKKNSFKFR